MSLAKRERPGSVTRAQLRSAGGPVPVTRAGETVAVLLTPAELERLEDERDAAIQREAIARGPTDAV